MAGTNDEVMDSLLSVFDQIYQVFSTITPFLSFNFELIISSADIVISRHFIFWVNGGED